MLRGGAFYFYSHKGSLFLCIEGHKKRRGGRARGQLPYALIQLYNNNTNLRPSCLSLLAGSKYTLAAAETISSFLVFSSHHWDRVLSAGF